MDLQENLSEDNLVKKYSFNKRIYFFIASFILFLILIGYLFFSAPLNFPTGKIYNLEQGNSLRILSKNLKEKKIIRSRFLFETFVIIYGGEKHINPGDYLFENKLSVFEIARRVSKGEYHLAPIKITIPEGFDIEQIAEVASLKLVNFNKNNFLVNAKNLEGYLFPDTYFFFSTANDEDVLKYLNDNFKKKIFSIQFEFNKNVRTEKEIIIMASIIEREAKGDADRAIISGILWNRISKNMPLQVDVASETYKIKGLPEAPICNPGLEAIRAALDPVKSSYLYYLHDKDGLIHYARTFEEHKINKSKYLK